MSSIPTSPLSPGDPEYNTIHDLWVKQGSAGWVEYQKEGWLRKVIWPAGGSQPTFILFCSAAGESTEDFSSEVSGYGKAMASIQRSYSPRGVLPKEAI